MSDVPKTPDQLTLVLLGKTGSGKSTLGNELLRKRLFKVGGGPVSVTEHCSAKEGVCAGRRLLVLDTPGTMDVKNPQRAIAEIHSSIDSCPDGVDAFVVVLNWNSRFTEEEAAAIEEAVNVFGSKCYKRAIVVISHVDQNSMADFDNRLEQVRAQVARLDQLLNMLCNRYCPIDNGQLCATEVRQEQLKKLIDMCDSVSSSNPIRYSRRELEEQQRRQEEERRRQEEEKKKQKEEMRRLGEEKKRLEEEKKRLEEEKKRQKEKKRKDDMERDTRDREFSRQMQNFSQLQAQRQHQPAWQTGLGVATNIISAVANVAAPVLQARTQSRLGPLLPVSTSLPSMQPSLQRMSSTPDTPSALVHFQERLLALSYGLEIDSFNPSGSSGFSRV